MAKEKNNKKKATKVEKDTKKKVAKVTKNDTKKDKKEPKKSLWTRFMIYCHGVKSEAQKVRWTPVKDLVKYSVSTIIFIIFFALFFYGIEALFALLLKLI